MCKTVFAALSRTSDIYTCPDLMICSANSKEIHVVVIAVRWEKNIDQGHQRKLERSTRATYKNLQDDQYNSYHIQMPKIY